MRIYPALQTTRVITGRLATTGLPLLGLPARSPNGRQVRDAVRAPDGWVVAKIDWSQIELRIAAHLSGDTTMIRCFQDGLDIHTLTAQRILDAAASGAAPDDSARQMAKGINFGYWMGLGPKGLTEHMHRHGFREWSARCPGCRSHRDQHGPFCRSEQAFRDFEAQFPAARAYQERKRQECRETGFVTGLWGERWFLPGIWSPHVRVREATARQAYAIPIQSGNARLMKQAMTRIHQQGLSTRPGVEPILQVHDELVYLVSRDLVDAWLPQVITIMEHVATLAVPIVAVGSYGPSWLDQHSFPRVRAGYVPRKTGS